MKYWTARFSFYAKESKEIVSPGGTIIMPDLDQAVQA